MSRRATTRQEISSLTSIITNGFPRIFKTRNKSKILKSGLESKMLLTCICKKPFIEINIKEINNKIKAMSSALETVLIPKYTTTPATAKYIKV